jgi:hypothetical protein
LFKFEDNKKSKRSKNNHEYDHFDEIEEEVEEVMPAGGEGFIFLKSEKEKILNDKGVLYDLIDVSIT